MGAELDSYIRGRGEARVPVEEAVELVAAALGRTLVAPLERHRTQQLAALGAREEREEGKKASKAYAGG